MAWTSLNITVTLTSGFGMDKYPSNIVSDFIFANAGYFQTCAILMKRKFTIPLPEKFILI